MLFSVLRRQPRRGLPSAWPAACAPTARMPTPAQQQQSRVVWWHRGFATGEGRRRRRRLRGIKSDKFWSLHHKKAIQPLATKVTLHFTIHRYAPFWPPAQELQDYLASGHSRWWLNKYGSGGGGGGGGGGSGGSGSGSDALSLTTAGQHQSNDDGRDGVADEHTAARTLTRPAAAAAAALPTTGPAATTAADEEPTPRPKFRWGHPEDLHLAFVTTKRQFGPRAVDRNRARRRVKECARAQLLTPTATAAAAGGVTPLSAQLDPQYWYVVFCSRPCLSASYEELCHSWAQAMEMRWKVPRRRSQRGGDGGGGKGTAGKGKGGEGAPHSARKTWRQIAARKKQKANIIDQRKARGDRNVYRKARRERLYGKESREAVRDRVRGGGQGQGRGRHSTLRPQDVAADRAKEEGDCEHDRPAQDQGRHEGVPQGSTRERERLYGKESGEAGKTELE
jgi:hypothetical protein